ncbi:hypothetical protein [Nitrosomonas sp.]|uniref:hypothetical protein n=1 Tax=Nitrosomonas sp. TaxID=42353 RepID=UPI0025FDB7E2|nr:hypothetical protein [Nitrosomonas sp.]MBY0485067.1 hypothetical protein [Nitrosomonas sp.]
MAADNNHDSKTGLIPILLLIMLATGTLINPLTSSRPHDSQYTNKLLSSDVRKVDARLWQDPIAAVERHLNQDKEAEKKLSPKSIDEFRKEIGSKIQNDTDLRIIAISVFGSSYPELTEFRQRYRYAVVSALGARGYFAKDTEHINFYRLEPSCVSDVGTHCPSIDVPYEWFKDSFEKQVLILWLNEDKIPATGYGNFIKVLFNGLKKIQSGQFDFSLIGPTNTSLLVELMKSTEIDGLSASFKIISSSATISDKDLFDAIKKDNQCDKDTDTKKAECIKEKITKKLADKSIFRTIGQDINLAKALIWELGQRGVNRKIPFIKDECEDGLIIISEQDSLYARLLTKHFIDSVNNEQCAKKENEKQLVANFTYLRGLDGKLPDLDESSRKSQDTQDKKEQKNLIAQLDDASPEHAEGRNQFDYLRRLIDKIEEIDRGEGLGTNRIKAIGIFGNDVYDKLLILQALRDRFKHKIFFTTELDARYLHADQKKWTRNLIVASNFDFTLRPELQGTTMPFRDSYQTSMYLATLLALNFPTTKIDNWAQLWINEWPAKSQKLQLIEQTQQLDGLLKPQIFEIGRAQAVHLASPPIDYLDTWIKDPADTRFPQKNIENNNDRCVTKYLLGCDAIEQERQKEIDTKVISQLLILISTILILGYLSFKSVAESLVTVIGSVISCAAIGFILLWYCLDNFSNYQTGEPFLWLEGVSVWPNLVIRYFGIIFILLVFHHYYTKLREAKEIINDLKLPELQESKGNGHWWEGLWSGPFSGFTSTGKNVKEPWLEYLKITDLIKSKGYLWILCTAAISLGLTYFGIFSLGYLNFPSRGEITQNLHNFIAFVQFSILWGLIYWVGYEATACRRFIDQLDAADQFDWPQKLVEEHENRTGISREELKPYFRFLLITRLLKRVNSIIYMPFVLMLLIAIGRSNVFDNLGFSPALIIVFIGASIYLIITLILLKKSAEKQCEDILQFYEEDRPGRISLAFGNANTVDQVVTEIRNKKQQTFSFFQQPSLLALLLPGGGIGLTSIVEYLYN